MLRLVAPAAVAIAVMATAAAPVLAQATAATPSATPAATKSKFDTLTDGLKHEDGFWSVYHNDQKLLVHLKNADLGKNFVVITSIARGISRGAVLGGMSWGFGDEVIWNFRKVGDNLHILRKNVRFRAKPGTPEANAVKLAYSDSVLYAIPILTTTSQGMLIDMTRIFMSDDEQIGQAIGPGFRFAQDRSTWAKVKSHSGNVELQVSAVYAGGGSIDTVSDTRGVQVHVHYSISELPSNGYTPREADDRVGYFLTVVKDFSNTDDNEHFVRYINRWNLQKADPNATLSPPKEPIIFYLEKTVPIRLRPIVREGIEEWNKAFEKIGFANAIEVRQQRDEDDWDPEDIKYNTFRWITAEAGFAMGPSRVNPLTGQILDADIIFDASFLKFWKTDYETFSPQAVNSLMLGGGLSDDPGVALSLLGRPQPGTAKGLGSSAACNYGMGMQQQVGFAGAALAMQGQLSAKGELPEEFIKQGLKEVVMHEVGHTLGLRHNFKASSWKSLAEIDDPVKGPAEGTVGSVMDYCPANIAPAGAKQGLFYPTTIGPYDYWAIEYGYKPIAANEKAELAKIAARGAEKGLHYATDEDTRGSLDSDPLVNRFDLGANPLEFVERRMKISSELLPKVLDRTVKDGEGYQRARQAFGMLFSEYWRAAFFASRFPGGLHVNRDHKADPNGRPPFQVVDAGQQRQAMKLLGQSVFSSPSYDPKTLNYLAASRWSHWGTNSLDRLDYPIHDFVATMQERILSQLMSPNVMQRLHDNELKLSPDQDSYTLAEHERTLVEQLFTEWKANDKAGEFTNRKPYVSSYRRNLQRIALKRFAAMVTAGSSYPEDARTLARMHLAELDQQLTATLAKQDLKLDDYSRAHLTDCQQRIRQVLNQQLTTTSVN